MDQLANFVAYSPLAQAIQDGEQLLTDRQNSPQHLNPLFGAWLMGWPSTWVIAEPHALSALETASWRSVLQLHLCYLLGEQESFESKNNSVIGESNELRKITRKSICCP